MSDRMVYIYKAVTSEGKAFTLRCCCNSSAAVGSRANSGSTIAIDGSRSIYSNSTDRVGSRAIYNSYMYNSRATVGSQNIYSNSRARAVYLASELSE